MNHASVFSGIGGPEVAATMLGWQNLFHCEINPFGRTILNYWFPNSKSYEDITTTDFSEWRGKVDVLTGGFPCQPFSYAGKRRGAKDDRYLWPSMFRCIDQVQPRWIVAENVAGIATMVEQGEVSELECKKTLFDEGCGVRRYQLRGTFTLERICQNLENHGYAVQPILIPACAVGAPHRRDRVFIVANAVGSGTGAPRKSRSTESQRCDTDKQPNQWREPSERLGGLYELLRNAADTNSNGQPTPDLPNRCKRLENTDAVGQRWAAFPSVAAVHRGNDGFPFDVDHLTISFAKWRQESLKAYGNAIVPQVIYEIFRAIEIVDNQLINQSINQ